MGSTSESLVGTVLSERFHLARFVARGGMGEVYEAHDQKRNRSLAIKLLRPELSKDPEWCARFERECKVAAAIDSPYVARLVQAGETRTGLRWIAFEFLEGESLDARLVREGRVPFAEVEWMIQHLLLGLLAAHEHGVIHRDIKPGNLFVVTSVPKLVVLDFGVAKRAGGQTTELTSLNAMLGTPSYMSPEQLMNSKNVDPRTDLYSVGLVVYRALGGRLPFQHREWGQMLESKLHGALPSLASASETTWPEAMEGWLRHTVAAQREDRFGSAQAALQGWQAVCGAMRTHVPRPVPVSVALREADTDLAPLTELDRPEESTK
jgi:serine/threonine-protein kinase